MAPPLYDVGIVGYGPVGQALAAMLGRDGHRVVVLERWPTLFDKPKAGHLDHEVIRIMQSIGAAEGVVDGSWPMTGYDLLDREGWTLVAMDWNHDGASGWHSDYSAYQPNLEAVLDRIVRGLPRVEVCRGWEAVAVRQHEDRVDVEARQGAGTRTVACRYVVGADGASSVVRETAGITRTDYGFEADFLVVHVLPHDPEMKIDMPAAAQICDPARPVSIFRRHGNHNPRWEFMLLPGETPAEMETPATCWRLIAPWGLDPSNSDLFYFKVYRFNSLVADTWRAGRALLAGDAAHLMPPFLGQGLCSGFRDAMTLAWKLDLVLRGVAPDSLLDTYAEERRPHVEAIVKASMEVGRMVCTTDPTAAEERDRMLRSGSGPRPQGLPGLTAGVLRRDASGGPVGASGALFIQGRVRCLGREGRFDDVVGGKWQLLALDDDPLTYLDAARRAFLERIGARAVRLVRPEGPQQPEAGLLDLDGAYHREMGRYGARVVLVRPDFYLFGSAPDVAGVVGLVDDLRDRLLGGDEAA